MAAGLVVKIFEIHDCIQGSTSWSFWDGIWYSQVEFMILGWLSNGGCRSEEFKISILSTSVRKRRRIENEAKMAVRRRGKIDWKLFDFIEDIFRDFLKD